MPDGNAPRLSIGAIATLTVGSYIAGYMRDAELSAWGIEEVERHILLQVVTREIEGVETPVLHCVEAYRAARCGYTYVLEQLLLDGWELAVVDSPEQWRKTIGEAR